MLRHTFSHIKNITAAREKKLWQQNILSWEDYIKYFPQQLSLITEQHNDDIKNSIQALHKKDISYFINKINRHDFYRIAATFPSEVLFLDIETTGLSCYYDNITIIGWSIGTQYDVYIQGDDKKNFIQTMNTAKIIITFNGTLFDLKFIKKEFPSINIPQCHIDLRFFAKSVGLTGGQKSIEEQIGVQRPQKIKSILGESAPILWHKYKKGDIKSLKKLIEYNHADIEGMKHIFDMCIDLHYQKNDIPQQVQSKVKFSSIKSKITWRGRKNPDDGIVIHGYTGNTKPLISYNDLNNIINLSSFCVAGIDLVASEQKESGFCLLNGNTARTSRIKRDDAIISEIITSQANLVSIDSPLSIPTGRTTFWDDDPTRGEFGITRECERILKKRGISSYPCLIQSMQKLTQRGINLATKLRKLGIPVIESYPGAAQDIMNIPRKQMGIQYLKEGLADFGITGNFLTTEVSHDELDAITSAVVGLFFWSGKFEALGNFSEDYLIIPALNADNKLWLNRCVIGFSGAIGTGKTTSTLFLQEQGFKSSRFSDIIRDELVKKNIPTTRSNLQALGLQIYQNQKQRWLGKQVVNKIYSYKCIAIDGLRFPEDHATLIENFGPAFKHIHLECPREFLTQRKALGVEEDISLLLALTHDVEAGIVYLSDLAHIHICNDQSKESLFNTLKKLIRNHSCL